MTIHLDGTEITIFIAERALFVAPASRRRSCAGSEVHRTAGGTPAPQNRAGGLPLRHARGNRFSRASHPIAQSKNGLSAFTSFFSLASVISPFVSKARQIAPATAPISSIIPLNP